MTIDKTIVGRELAEAWADLGRALDGLSDDEMLLPGVIEEWSVKDLLGHIAFWAEKAAHDLALLQEGRGGDIETPGGDAGTDEWNRREAERRRGQTLKEARSECEAAHEASVAAFRAVPVELLDQEVKGAGMASRFGGDTFWHYREHAQQIRAWRRQLETTEE